MTIGNRVTITRGVEFITHDGSLWLYADKHGRRYAYAPIEIGNDVFIGLNAMIMPGVKIGSRVIVAAGALVSKSVPSNSVVAGVLQGSSGSSKNEGGTQLHIRLDIPNWISGCPTGNESSPLQRKPSNRSYPPTGLPIKFSITNPRTRSSDSAGRRA